jgi:hypothetical protein
MNISGLVAAVVQLAVSNTKDLSVSKDDLNLSVQEQFTPGTGNNQLDKIFHDVRTLLAAADESLDLAGSLVDSFGGTITFAKIKVLLIRNLSTTQTLTIGNGANPFLTWVGAAAHTVTIPPKGIFLLVAPLAGFTVTANTGDILKIANSATNPCDYQIVLAGTSA